MDTMALSDPADLEDKKLRTVVVENFNYPDTDLRYNWDNWAFSLEFNSLLNSACHFQFTFSLPKVSDEKGAHKYAEVHERKTGRLEIVFATAKDALEVYTSLQSTRTRRFGERIRTLVDPKFFTNPESHPHCTFFDDFSEYDVFLLNLPRTANWKMVSEACGEEHIRDLHLLPMPSGDGPLQAHVPIHHQADSERILAKGRDMTIYVGHMKHSVKRMNVKEYKKFMKTHTEYKFMPPEDDRMQLDDDEVEKELATVDASHLRKIVVKDLQHPGGWATGREMQSYLNKCSVFTATFSRPPGAPEEKRKDGQVDLIFATVQDARDAFKRLQHLLIDGTHPTIYVDPSFFVKPDPYDNGTFFKPSDDASCVYLINLPEDITGHKITKYFGGERLVNFTTLPMLARKDLRQAQILLADCNVAEKVLKGPRHFPWSHKNQKGYAILLSLDEYKEHTSSVDPGDEMTNWCHLPMEIRLKCIRLLDFESKMLLRRTSRTEKKLVESEKQKICDVYVSWDQSDCYIRFDDLGRHEDNVFRSKQMYGASRYDMDISLMSSIFKYGKVNEIHISAYKPSLLVPFFDEVFNAGGKLEAANIRLTQVADAFLMMFFENYKPKPDYSFNFLAISKYALAKVCNNAALKPVLLSATEIECEGRSRVPINEIVNWWIHKDVAANRKLTVDMRNNYNPQPGEEVYSYPSYHRKIFNKFAADYNHRIIDRNDDFIRIRTDNDKKHIVLKMFFYEGDCRRLVWRVIPSCYNMKNHGADAGWR